MAVLRHPHAGVTHDSAPATGAGNQTPDLVTWYMAVTGT
jgi:hypothetical protein